MRVLFISRKHPPSVGGMQRLSYQLISQMRDRVEATAITWGASQAALPLFLSWVLIRSMIIGIRGIDLVHLGDPILAPVGWILKALFRVPIVVTAHGLDVTYSFPPYQWIVPRLLRRMDRVVCISQSTYDACVRRGIPAEQCLIIHPGVSIPDAVPSRDESRHWLGRTVNHDLDSVAVLLTVGRLVPRKGVVWFIESVLPRLLTCTDKVCYIVVGTGPDEDRVRSAVDHRDLKDMVHLLGQVSEDDLSRAYGAADLFIMPNVRQQGDMEGFGLVALEAGAHALPVLAADLEGISDAIVVGCTGELLPSADAGIWVEVLSKYLAKPAKLQQMAKSALETVQQRFTWIHMVDAYEVLFRETLGQRDRQEP